MADQQPEVRVDIQKILGSYAGRVGALTTDLVLAEAKVDELTAMLNAERAARREAEARAEAAENAEVTPLEARGPDFD